jgi:hypothetical protein
MTHRLRVLTIAFLLILAPVLRAQSPSDGASDDSNARPPVTEADLRIVQRAAQILDSPSKWNRSDNRRCPIEARTFSLYCALEKASNEVAGSFQHRSAVMQQTRFVIDDIAPNRNTYKHRLMDYNNDPTTTFADIQKVFQLSQERITKRLAEESPKK